MPIYELQFADLGPFDQVDFKFDPRVNVFVGPNNCGKSTVLLALADLTVFPFCVPGKLLRRDYSPFQARMGATLRKIEKYEGVFPIIHPSKYWTDERFERFQLWRRDLGYTCLIPALRWSSGYRAEVTSRKDEESAKRTRRPRLVVVPPEQDSPRPTASGVGDQMIIQKIIDLDYRSYRENNVAIRSLLNKIGAVASEITEGFPIEFAGVEEDENGLYPEFKTPDGKLPINALSQGTQSIIQWLGLFLIGYAEHYEFPKNLEDKLGVVIIDEIDAHMHPSWQRRILPALSRHFPSVQVFCSSHSPFVLAGLKAGQAQLLKRDDKGRVVVSRNQTDLVGWSMDEILRNFLDITNPTDLQTSQDIERLQELRSKKRLTRNQKDELERLRETVSQELLAGPAVGEIERLAERIRNPAPKSPSRRKTPPAKKKAAKPSAKRTRRAGAKRTGRQR